MFSRAGKSDEGRLLGNREVFCVAEEWGACRRYSD